MQTRVHTAQGVVAVTLDVMVVLVDTRVTAQHLMSTGARVALSAKVAITERLETDAVVTPRLQAAAAEAEEAEAEAAHQHHRLAMEAPLALLVVAEPLQKAHAGTSDSAVYASTTQDKNNY